MPLHTHKLVKTRDIARDYYGVTKNLKEQVTITNRGTPTFILSPVANASIQASGLQATFTGGGGGGGGGNATYTDHQCTDFCIKCNRSQALDYLKGGGNI